MSKYFRWLVGAVEVRVVPRYGVRGCAAVCVHIYPQEGPCEITAFKNTKKIHLHDGGSYEVIQSCYTHQHLIIDSVFLRPLISPESIHLLHIIQGDHAISEDDVQQTIRAEQKLTSKVLPVQLGHFHQHAHRPGVHLVRVFPNKKHKCHCHFCQRVQK